MFIMGKKVLLGIVIILFVLLFIFMKQFNMYPSLKSIISMQGASSLGLQQVKDIPLSGGADRLDYQSIDPTTNKLYISHLGSSLVHVFDLGKQKVIADIP